MLGSRGRNPGNRHLASPNKGKRDSKNLQLLLPEAVESWDSGRCARSFCILTRLQSAPLGARPERRAACGQRRAGGHVWSVFSVCISPRAGRPARERLRRRRHTCTRMRFRSHLTGPFSATHQAEPCLTGQRVPSCISDHGAHKRIPGETSPERPRAPDPTLRSLPGSVREACQGPAALTRSRRRPSARSAAGPPSPPPCWQTR